MILIIIKSKHFAGVGKTIQVPKNAKKEINDIKLSIYFFIIDCFFISINNFLIKFFFIICQLQFPIFN